jgi:hypothetical protein
VPAPRTITSVVMIVFRRREMIVTARLLKPRLSD